MATFLLAGGSLPAQSVTQTIQGLVTDSSGAAVQGARVVIRNVGTGIERSLTSNDAGFYSFQLVEVGNYQVRCEAQGFRAQVVSGLRVETAAQVRQNFVLEIGAVTETVNVSASAVLLNTENATVGSVVENKRIVELPLNGRNIVQLAVLTPGVQFGNRSGMNNGEGGYIPNGSFSVSANGVRELHQTVSIDGTNAADPRRAITPFVPSIEAVEEFKIQTNSFSAEYGFGGGAVVNMTMKSGTNDLHGTLFEFLRNDKFDAENYFLNFQNPPGRPRARKDARRLNQFGFVATGPIVKNKTFWSANWEARREVTTGIGEAAYPTERMRRGDFGEVLTGAVNPATNRNFRPPIIVFDPFTGDPFPNNVIPQTRLHPGITNNILPVVPLPQFQAPDPLDINFRRPLPNPLNVDQIFGRVDHHFSERDRVFARLAVNDSSLTSERVNPNFPLETTTSTQNLATQWVHMVSQTMINEFRFGFQFFNTDSLSPRTNDESFSMDALGIGQFRLFNDGNRPLTPTEHGYPNLTLFNIGDSSTFNNPDRYEVGNHLTWVKGRHNLKFGFEMNRTRMNELGANLPTGRVNWSGNEAGLNFASFMLGVPSTTETAEGLPLTIPVGTRWGAYINDDFKIHPKVTLNYGLRFDYIQNPRDSKGLWRTLDFPGEGRGSEFINPATGVAIPTMGPEFVDERGAIKLWEQDVRFFMPRIGIAYRPSEKWVIRTGAGWFNNPMHWNAFTILSLNPPKSGSLLFQQVTDAVRTIPTIGADGANYNVATRRIRPTSNPITLNDPFLSLVGGGAVSRPVSLLHVRPDLNDGDVWKWSFDIQRELPFGTAFTVGYVGSKGSFVQNSITPFNNADPSPNTNVQARRPFPFFYDPATPQLGVQSLANIRYLDSSGNAFHHGLQTKLERRFASGVAAGVSYVFSKSHGDGEAGGNEEGGFQNPRVDRRDGRGRFRFDQTHNFVAHWVWEMPGGRLPGLLKHVLGGWQSNGIVSLRSGFPFNITQPNDLNTGAGAMRPDRIADGRLDNPTRQLWFDPQAFARVTCNVPARPELCRFGNAGYNVMNSPGQRNLDFGFFKNIDFKERYRLQFRSEFFNALNTPFFGQPTGIGFTSINSLVPDGARMGEVRTLRNPMRIIQFGLKLSF
ncbi:MAG: carboxypeptidase regulatory-like domain-containing protein [Bryobacterales bacterium]|nr:carboxypeptidase regulatory-like domain-containing protein [Bryobacterales bacterium]